MVENMSRRPRDGDQKTLGKGWLTGDLPFSHRFLINFDSDSIVIQYDIVYFHVFSYNVPVIFV